MLICIKSFRKFKHFFISIPTFSEFHQYNAYFLNNLDIFRFHKGKNDESHNYSGNFLFVLQYD